MSVSTQSKQTFRILHSGDIYLGRPFSLLRGKASEKRRAETKHSLMAMLQAVRDQHVDIVLLSGNLFDFNYVQFDVALRMLAEIGHCPDTQFFISPGPHDTADEQSFWRACAWPSNCHVFLGDLECVDLDDWNVSVYGWGISDPTRIYAPLEKPLPLKQGKLGLVCGYGAQTEGGKGASGTVITEQDIAKSGAVYVGLSDGGAFSGFLRADDTVYATTGPLESQGFEYEGFGGANLIQLEWHDIQMQEPKDSIVEQDEPKGAEDDIVHAVAGASEIPVPKGQGKTGGVTQDLPDATPLFPSESDVSEGNPPSEFQLNGVALKVERLLFGSKRYVTISLDVSEMGQAGLVEQALQELIRQRSYGPETVLGVVYTGHTAPTYTPPKLTDETSFGLAGIVSVDTSVPDRDEADYARDMSIRGELIRALSPSADEKNEKNKENIAKALRIAFAALDNGDISNI